jgi:hypothetical protein
LIIEVNDRAFPFDFQAPPSVHDQVGRGGRAADEVGQVPVQPVLLVFRYQDKVEQTVAWIRVRSQTEVRSDASDTHRFQQDIGSRQIPIVELEFQRFHGVTLQPVLEHLQNGNNLLIGTPGMCKLNLIGRVEPAHCLGEQPHTQAFDQALGTPGSVDRPEVKLLGPGRGPSRDQFLKRLVCQSQAMGHVIRRAYWQDGNRRTASGQTPGNIAHQAVSSRCDHEIARLF